MKFLMVTVNMEGISRYEMDRIPERIDDIVRPYHLKWVLRNMYFVEDGYDEDLAIDEAWKALEKTDWLKNKIYLGVMQSISKCRLDEIQIEDMAEPEPDKVNKYRNYFEEHGISENNLTYPNPIVVDQNRKLLDGYISYLIMKERGYTYAECILENRGNTLKKYVYGIHMPGTNEKKYKWSYPLRDAVVPGDILLAETSQGVKSVKVTGVEMGTEIYVDGLKKIRKMITV